MGVHIFGVRHHGAGSARSLLTALDALQPDCILIEGPPEGDALLPLAAHPTMQPPVALLVYNPDEPKRAAWYPFALYSPEWQAIQYALRHGVEVAFMDLPQRHMLALEPEPLVAEIGDDDPAAVLEQAAQPAMDTFDPLQMLAKIAGETDGEAWWNRVVEESRHPTDLFDSIREAMTLLRAEREPASDWLQTREALREAWMRKTIRTAEKTHERVAVVCGAWHSPALHERSSAKQDNDLLKGLPSLKVQATFAPWTYSRIAREAGYGAGVRSPGWYHHLWETESDAVAASWLAKVAALLRDEGLLASTAQVIDALRLAETLAVLRGRSVGLDELNEASLAVLCGGQPEPLALIRRKLIIGERMGGVPEDTPAVPLQRDIEAQQKRLRLKVSLETALLDLDLRQPTDLARSHLFHRLNLLGIVWAQLAPADVRVKGTFHEFWNVRWAPELAILMIEASVWGNTLEEAAINRVRHDVEQVTQLRAATALLDAVLLSSLGSVTDDVLCRLDDLASVTHDIPDLMDATPPLVNTLHYGSVRKTDTAMLASILESIALRVCIGLRAACANIDDDAAAALRQKLQAFHAALVLSERDDLTGRWHETLRAITEGGAVHPLLSGTAAKLLFRADKLSADDAARLLSLAFSVGSEPVHAALWLEGFLRDMEHLLLRSDALFALVDEWLGRLGADHFQQVLPLLRRTFATFSAPTRRNIGERARKGERTVETLELDDERAARVLPVMRQLLGLES